MKELKDLKKADKEKEKQKEKEKEKEKMRQKEKNEEEINDYHNDNNNKKSNLKSNKDKNKKNVHFSKFSESDKYKDNDNDNNDNNLKKENVNNFIINTKNNSKKVSEDKNKNSNNNNNFIIFEGSDFSFHDEMDEDNPENEKEKVKKPLRQDIISKKTKTDICEYKNDKKVISKLDKNFDNKDISVSSIDNLRQKIYLFTFKFDKFNSHKINIERISFNEDMIENNLKLFYDKKNNSLLLRSNNRFQYNENKAPNKNNDLNINNKRESYDLFDNSNNDQNDQNNQNSIVKYNESILNRSNINLQSEPNVNSNNNSYISNNNNNSIINDNNNYFLYDNNFMINNEDDDSSFKNKDSVKDPSLDFSSIKKYYKKGILKDTDDQEKYNSYLIPHIKKLKNPLEIEKIISK